MENLRPIKVSELMKYRTVYYEGQKAKIVKYNKFEDGNVQICLDIHEYISEDDEGKFDGFTFYRKYFTTCEDRVKRIPDYLMYTELKVIDYVKSKTQQRTAVFAPEEGWVKIKEKKYSRKKVVELLNYMYNDSMDDRPVKINFDLDKWIEENL